MKTEIRNQQDVAEFARMMVREGVIFHPDTDFNDYINLNTNQQTYSEEEAKQLNETLSNCFDICDRESLDIYSIMLEANIAESKKLQIPPFN